MANLFKALYYLLDCGPGDTDPNNWEGGYSNDPFDHGGETNYGITQRELNRYLASHPTSTIPDRVSKFSVKDAETIYRENYWKYDLIADQAIATKLFDMGVNMGVATAVKMVQRCLGITVDGVYGPKTRDAINAADGKKLMQDLIDASVKRYLSIIERDPTQERFRKGWMRRAKSVPPGD